MLRRLEIRRDSVSVRREYQVTTIAAGSGSREFLQVRVDNQQVCSQLRWNRGVNDKGCLSPFRFASSPPLSESAKLSKSRNYTCPGCRGPQGRHGKGRECFPPTVHIYISPLFMPVSSVREDQGYFRVGAWRYQQARYRKIPKYGYGMYR